MTQSLAGISSFAAQSLGIGARGGSIADTIAKALEFSGSGKAKSGGPVDTIQISDAAQAKLKRAQADRVIAERLIAELDKRAGKKPGAGSSSSAEKAADADVAALLKANGITIAPKSESGVALTGDPTLDIGIFDGNHDPVTGRVLKNAPGTPISDQERASIFRTFQSWESPDNPMDPALKAAFANGTLKMFRAEDVPGLDYRKNAERITDSSGKITGQLLQNKWNDAFFGPQGQPFYRVDPSFENYSSSVFWGAGIGGVLLAWEKLPKKAA
jgi:hypothetical protein